MRTGQRTVVVLVAAAFVVAACGPAVGPSPSTQPPSPGASAAASPSPTGVPRGGSITYVNFEPATLNPLNRPEAVAWQVNRFVARGLSELDARTGEWIPQLAESLPTIENGGVSPDGLTVTWRLREGLKWSDGKPLTSDDLKFTWEVCSNPEAGCARSEGFVDIASVETPDDRTIVLRYKKLYQNYLGQFRDGILPRHSSDVGPIADFARWEYGRTVNPGTGPFVVKEWVAGDRIVLERNPNFYLAAEGKPYLDRITVVFRNEQEAGRQMVLNGEAQMYPWPGRDAPIINQLIAAGLQVQSNPSPYVRMLTLNPWDPADVTKPHPVLGDKRVREAIYSGLNFENVFLTYDNPEQGIKGKRLTTIFDMWPQYTCGIEPFPYDLVRAGQLLDEAGWRMGGDGYRAKDGQRLRLRITVYTGFGEEDREVVLIDEAKKLGIELVPFNHDAAVLYSGYNDGSPMMRGDFDLLWWDETPQMPDPSGRLVGFFHSRSIPGPTNNYAYNIVRLSDPEVDAWIDEATSTLDTAVRKDRQCKVSQRRIKEDIVWRWMIAPTQYWISSPQLKGWVGNELFSPIGWDAENWYLEP